MTTFDPQCSIPLMRHVTFIFVGVALVCSMVGGIWSLTRPPVPFANEKKELSGTAFTAALKELNAQIASFRPKSPEESEQLRLLFFKREFLKEYCYLPDAETLKVFAYPSLWERAAQGWSQDSCYKVW